MRVVDNWGGGRIPPRPWVIYKCAARGAVTVVVGPPGAMKSSLMLTWACALALGRSHGNTWPNSPGTTLVYGAEDDWTEQCRRISVALSQFEAAPTDINGKIICATPGGHNGALFCRDKDDTVAPTSAMSDLCGAISGRHPDMLIIDPLIGVHSSTEGVVEADIMRKLQLIAEKYKLAVVLVHHTYEGDLDNARATAAVTKFAKIVFTVSPMSVGDAADCGVPQDQKNRLRYIRVESRKGELELTAPPWWYEKEPQVLLSVEKDLQTFPSMEGVYAVVPWVPPADGYGKLVKDLCTPLDLRTAPMVKAIIPHESS